MDDYQQQAVDYYHRMRELGLDVEQAKKLTLEMISGGAEFGDSKQFYDRIPQTPAQVPLEQLEQQTAPKLPFAPADPLGRDAGSTLGSLMPEEEALPAEDGTYKVHQADRQQISPAAEKLERRREIGPLYQGLDKNNADVWSATPDGQNLFDQLLGSTDYKSDLFQKMGYTQSGLPFEKGLDGLGGMIKGGILSRLF